MTLRFNGHRERLELEMIIHVDVEEQRKITRAECPMSSRINKQIYVVAVERTQQKHAKNLEN